MYVGWFFDSNQNNNTVIADYEFNPSPAQKQSPFYRQMYQEHERIKKIRGAGLSEYHNDRKQTRNK